MGSSGGVTHGDAADDLRRLVRSFAPSWIGRPIADATPLGASGFGLDSIAIVELLVACEQRFGVPFPDSLLDARPLTLGTLVRHLENGEPSPEGA